jgi:tripartite-type tricarboxylate transporter receptor subunit TctC
MWATGHRTCISFGRLVQARTMMRSLGAGLAIAGIMALSGTAQAQDAVAEFYKGKQVTISVGSSPGGGYDTYARLISRFLGRHIPGAPSVLVNNMPGAGGNVLANQLYTVGPKDGTAIGAVQSGVILEPLFGNAAVKHRPEKFTYLGSANNDVYICVVRADAPTTTFADTFDKQLILAASNNASTSDYAELLNNVLGTKFRVVVGYSGSTEIGFAIDKGEANGACGLAWPSIAATKSDWFQNGPTKSKMRVLVQTHAKGHRDLNAAHIPLASDFAKTDEQKAILDLFFSQSTFGRPYLLPPGVPEDRVAVLRRAFADTMVDPDYVAEAKKMRLDVDAVPGAEVQDAVSKVYAATPELVAKTRNALKQQ